MRDRLIELCRNAAISCGLPSVDMPLIADYLLKNGVIVPPCKVGDAVFQTDGVRIYPLIVERVIYDTAHIAFDERAIGRSIFLTREEAEQAMKEAQG